MLRPARSVSRTIVAKTISSNFKDKDPHMTGRGAMVPSMYLDFLNNELNPRISFTRASAGTYFGSDGLLKVQGYNLLTYSDNFSNANWNKAGNPSINGELVSRTLTTSTYVSHFATGLSLGDPFSFQLKAKAATIGGRIGLRVQGAYPARVDAVFDLNTGTVVGSAAVTYTVTGASITSLPNGYYLCTISGVSVSMAPTIALFGPTDSGFSVGAWESASNMLSNCFVKDAQLERASTPGNYSPTSGAANGGPRFDYDPATPAGTTGVELAPSTTSLVGWNAGGVTPILTSDGTAITIKNGGSGEAYAVIPGIAKPGKTYRIYFNMLTDANMSVTAGGTRRNAGGGTGFRTLFITSAGFGGDIRFGTNDGTVGAKDTFSDVSVQEVTFAPRGLLIEEARTNLLRWSRDFMNAVWTKTDVTVAPAMGIDGVAGSADLITEGSAGTARISQAVAISAGVTTTFSVVIKKGTLADWFRLTLTTGPGSYDVWFNVLTGVIGAKNAIGTAALTSANMTPIGGGYYRCAITAQCDTAGTTATGLLNSSAGDNQTGRVPNATYTVDCAQLEVGAFATSIIPTTSATVTRATDVAQVTGTNFSSWFNESAGTFALEYVTSQYANTPSVLCLSDNATSTPGLNTPGAGSARWWNGTSNVVTSNYVALGNTRKECFAYLSAERAICLNAGPVSSDTLAPWSGLRNKAVLGAAATGAQNLNGHIRRLAYYPTRLPNTQLQALTAP